MRVKLLIFTLLGGMFWLGLASGWQEKIADNLFLPRPVHNDIVIIAIDDRSINTLGRWPWDRKVHAQLLDLLATQKPRSIGYDVAFPEKSNATSDGLLIDAFKKHNIVLPIEQVKDGLQKPNEIFKTLTGQVNVLIDFDGVVRKIPSDSFASKIVAAKVPGDFMRINYVGKPGSFTTYSFVDVLNKQVPLENFADKYVLVGATAVDLHDVQITPVSAGKEMAGVEIHANAMQTILDKKYLVLETRIQTLLWILLASLLSPLSVLTIIAYIIFAFVSFDNGVIRNLIYPPLAVVVINIINIIVKYWKEKAAKEYIKKAFSYYLSDSVLAEILKNPSKLKLGGERKEITVLFSDIAGFTTISEKLPPEELAKKLNDYLTRMTNIVFKYRGVLDKYIGDAVMAFWNAPIADADHALKACKTALEMQEQAGEFGMRIGINTGEMVVGNMGSQMRFDYSLLGDNVNLGSRLEGTNKEYGTKILISESTCNLVKDKFITRFIDTVAVKGKEQGVKIYELRSTNYDPNFDKAHELYEKGEFDKAAKIFAKIKDDPPSEIFLKRCQEGWNGIYHAKMK